jgi:endonuclease/exonuclease/phosphatase family metal-dependent hydrolase
MTHPCARTTTAGRPIAGLLAILLVLLTTGPLLAGTAASAGAVPTAAAADRPGKPLTVMTRNIYLGGDIFRPLRAAQQVIDAGGTQAQVVGALAVASDATRRVVDLTDFRVRSRLLAQEIAETQPDLIGLQEVALWRSGPMELGKLGVTNATTVDYDFLEILRADIAALGLEYDVAVEGERADVEVPAFTATMANPRDVRLTMRDVVLKKRGLKVTAEDDQRYAHNLPVSLAGVDMNFSRGYQWVDVRAGDRRLRFVNTHLEAASSDLALAQAMEAAGAVATDRPTILACDCNSDPLNSDIKPDDTVPHKAAYEFLTGPAGFTDQWLEWAPAEEGWTSGLSERVNDETAAGFDHRIDLILSHTPSGDPFPVQSGAITGDEVTDRDPATGLWPSDHAGVVLRLRGL